MGQYLFTIQNMDSKWLVPIRLGLAGIILFFYSLIKMKKELFVPWKTPRSALTMLIYGLAGVSCCQFFYFLTIELSSAAVGTILQDLAPVFILVVTCIVARRKPRILEIVAIVLALTGVFFLTTHGKLHSMSISKEALMAGIISAICVAIYNLLAPRLREVPVIVIQTWSFLLGGCFGVFAFRIWNYHYVPNLQGILGIAFVVVIGNIMAFTLYIKGVQIIGPSKASLYSFAEPITAAVISATVLKTAFTLYDAIGFVLIFAMLWLITVDKKAQE